jgi:hypothetical protein
VRGGAVRRVTVVSQCFIMGEASAVLAERRDHASGQGRSGFAADRSQVAVVHVPSLLMISSNMIF